MTRLERLTAVVMSALNNGDLRLAVHLIHKEALHICNNKIGRNNVCHSEMDCNICMKEELNKEYGQSKV